jgi:type IX secretion system PorP/SprF family membrane protein
MRKLTIILSFVVVALNAQYSLPTQIDRNLLYVNPAYAGSLEATVASVMHRSQWVNVPGGITFQNFELHAPLKKQSIAMGFQVRHESIGLQNKTEVFINYAHRIKLDKSTLAFSLKAGGQSLSYQEPNFGEVENWDPALAGTSSFLPNLGFGLAYYSPNYNFGVSIPYFFGSVSTSDGSSQIDFDMSRLAYILSAGGSISVNESLKIQPIGAVYYSTTLKPQVTGIVNLKYMDSFLLGAGYRLHEGIIVNVGYFLSEQFSVEYSYDINIGDIAPYSNGTHELGLLYYFGYKVNTVNPRDF